MRYPHNMEKIVSIFRISDLKLYMNTTNLICTGTTFPNALPRFELLLGFALAENNLKLRFCCSQWARCNFALVCEATFHKRNFSHILRFRGSRPVNQMGLSKNFSAIGMNKCLLAESLKLGIFSA